MYRSNMIKLKKTRKSFLAFMLICGLFCSFNLFSKNNSDTSIKESNKSLEEQWFVAVLKGDFKVSLELASKILPTPQINNKISPLYLQMGEREGIEHFFDQSSFNKLDFKLWYDAIFLKMQLYQYKVLKSKDNHELLSKILKMVVDRIKPLEKKSGIIPWPAGVWFRKYGLCDRMSWLFAELAYQAGFKTQIVYLISPKTGISPHTICEVLSTDKNGKVTISTIDPFSKFILYGTSVANLANNGKLMNEVWGKRKDWRDALPHSIFWTPAYPQDYCPKNQKLYKILYSKLGPKTPKFGEDPNTRMLNYKKLANMGSEFKMGLWFYPFRLLKSEMKFNSIKK